jgi:hypothetical protein
MNINNLIFNFRKNTHILIGMFFLLIGITYIVQQNYLNISEKKESKILVSESEEVETEVEFYDLDLDLVPLSSSSYNPIIYSNILLKTESLCLIFSHSFTQSIAIYIKICNFRI